jgi:hypothetical protein
VQRTQDDQLHLVDIRPGAQPVGRRGHDLHARLDGQRGVVRDRDVAGQVHRRVRQAPDRVDVDVADGVERRSRKRHEQRRRDEETQETTLCCHERPSLPLRGA